MTFAGFPARARATAIPNVFFSDVLPQLTDLTELGVVLFALRAVLGKRGFPRYVTGAEIENDPSLAAFLSNAKAPDDAISSGLRRAVHAGVLLSLAVEREGRTVPLYFLNAPSDRRGMDAVRAGAVDVGHVVHTPATASVEPSGVVALYESLVGTLSPLLLDELTEAERLYPYAWLEAAFREAAAQNARSWRYVATILERWAAEGPDYATTERGADGGDRYFEGKYGRILRQRIGG